MSKNWVQEYLSARRPSEINMGFLAYLCNLDQVASVTPEVAASVVRELENQRRRVKLIASENYCSLAVQLAMGNLLTDKYAEGMPSHRFYAGNENVDAVETLAAKEACEVFGAEYANVQPHCGVDANMLAYWAIISTRVEAPVLEYHGKKTLYELGEKDWFRLRATLGNQKLLGLDYYSGGHLTHGYRYNVSGRMFDVESYGVSRETGLLDYDEIEKKALDFKPLILLAGYSAYPRQINFRRMREIADKAGAVLMVDMAHFAGLVAGKVFEGDYNPVAHADVVTSTTHKTFRGPRAGFVLARREFADALDKGCPLTMGGPLPHVIASKAVAFREAKEKSFVDYARQIVKNAQALAAVCAKGGFSVLTGGTDNHLFLLNIAEKGLTGRQAENALHDCDIILNRNALPFDPNGPWYTAGLRIGTAAVTTQGMKEAEMEELGGIIVSVLKATRPAPDGKGGKSRIRSVIDEAAQRDALDRVAKLVSRFPVYPELDLDYLKKAFCQ
ncbi:MAG: glycine hydroxymethyltransferase [Spirochaetaceae bacterium]|nr:glycine hydroxymethyltransferase [Spirochaetaceae bacterium]